MPCIHEVFYFTRFRSDHVAKLATHAPTDDPPSIGRHVVTWLLSGGTLNVGGG